jgi:hypothetical protein
VVGSGCSIALAGDDRFRRQLSAVVAGRRDGHEAIALEEIDRALIEIASIE